MRPPRFAVRIVKILAAALLLAGTLAAIAPIGASASTGWRLAAPATGHRLVMLLMARCGTPSRLSRLG